MKNINFLFIFILIIACNDNQMIKQPNGHFLKVEKYASGQLKSRQTFIQNKNRNYIADGFFVSYYENGILADTALFLNGKKNGLEQTYYNSGKLKSSFFYLDGKPDSTGYVFYPNGNVAEYYFRTEGVMLGMQLKYDTNKTPSYMLFSTFLDSLAFEVYFNSDGTIRDMVGHPLYVIEEKHNKVNVDDIYRTMNFVPQIGKIKAKLNIIIKDHDFILVNKSISQFEKIWNAYGYFFDFKFKKPGKYSYNAVVELYDSTNNKTLKLDTVSALVNIRKK